MKTFSFSSHPHLNYLQHLRPADVPVPVQVVHAEGPAQLLLQAAAGRHAQGDDELPEVDGGVAVGVKRAEDVLGELGGVAVREEVGVDLLELLHGEVAGGTVLEEAAVPLLQLVVGELGVFPQVVQDLGPQLAVLFPHVTALSLSVSLQAGGSAGVSSPFTPSVLSLSTSTAARLPPLLQETNNPH